MIHFARRRHLSITSMLVLTAFVIAATAFPSILAAAPVPPFQCPATPDVVAPDPPIFHLPKNDAYGVFSLFPDHENTLPALEDLEIGWIRVQLEMGDTSAKAKLDALVDNLPDLLTRGIGTWLTLYHRDRDNVADTVLFDLSTRGGFPPVDYGRYTDLVTSTVCVFTNVIEAYGLDPVDWLAVQFGNEVLPREEFRPHAFWHGSGDEYLEMLEHGYAAVKKVDRLVPVAAAGISSGMLEAVLAEPSVSLEPGVDPEFFLTWMDDLLTLGSYDWADVHLRHLIADAPEKISWVLQRAHGRLAATEVAGPDSRSEPWILDLAQEELDELQAQDLPVRLQVLEAAGVERVFWAGLVESELVGPDHESEGLIRIESVNEWYRKPAYFAYQTLIVGEAAGSKLCPPGAEIPAEECP